MRKIIGIVVGVIVLSIVCYFTFLYYASYSEGVRSGQLIKFSHKGVVIKTWEGELSNGMSGANPFPFSVMDNQEKVIADLKNLEGQFVKLNYVERYKTFPWWGDTKYFIVGVEKGVSPFNSK